MKILLISDTHGKTAGLRRLLSRMKPAPDMILHMGDVEGDEDEIRSMAGCPVEFVRGNCDPFSRNPVFQVIRLQGHTIFMTHGHRYGVKHNLEELIAAARAENADIVLFGHTHIQKTFTAEGMTFVNPGSLTYPHDGTGNYGFALLEIDQNQQCHVSLGRLQ